MTCTCKICGAKAFEFCSSCFLFEGRSYKCNYYRCIHCNFHFTTAFDLFSKHYFQRFYAYPDYLEIDEWARLEHQGKGPGRVEIQLESLAYAEKLSGRTPSRILVFGNGTCKLPEVIRDQGSECYIMSPWDQRLDAQNIPSCSRTTYSGYFDCIISAEVFEHFIDPINDFSDLLRLLRPGGWLIGTTGAVEWYRSVRPDDPSYYLTGNPRNGHTAFYSREAISIIATKLNIFDATTRAALSGHDARKWRIAFCSRG